MSESRDVFNRFVVCATAEHVLVGMPPREPLTPLDALILAAWLVAIAESMSDVTFETILHQVKST